MTKPPVRLSRKLVEDGVAQVPPGWVLDAKSEFYVPPDEKKPVQLDLFRHIADFSRG